MSQTKNFKIAYPLIGSAIALCGTGALFLGLLGTWLACCLGANVFLAAGLVCGTEVRPVRRKNPLTRFSQDEPAELEGYMYRVPIPSAVAALVAALIAGLIARSAVIGLLTLFTWGGLGLPLAGCILTRSDFGLSLQTGLLTSILFTGIAGVIQVFISSPGNSFSLSYCFETVANRLKDALTAVLTEAQTLTQSQDIALPNGTDVSNLIGTLSAEEAASQAVELFLSIAPAIFTIGILTLMTIVWWGTKAALKRDPAVEIKHMGRLDGYRPGRILSPLYFVFLLVNMFSESGSVLQIAAMNVVSVASAILTFAGFSVVLFIINTRARSTVARVFLIIATVLVSLSSCGGSLLLIAGLFSTGRDLRGTFGGGTYQ